MYLLHFTYFKDFDESITSVCIGDYDWGGGSYSCRSGLERYYVRVTSSNTVECCPHDHWRSTVIIIYADETCIVADGFITQCHIAITKLNVVFNCTSCIKQLPLNTETSAVTVINWEKSINKNRIWYDWKELID